MLRRLLTRTVGLLMRYAAEPDDGDEWRLKKTIAVATAMFGTTAYFVYGLIYIAFNEPAAGVLVLVAGTLSWLGLVSYARFRHYRAHFYYWISLLAAVMFFASLLLGGLANSGFVTVWLLMVPLLTLVCMEPRFSFRGLAAVAALLLISALLEPFQRPSNNLPRAVVTVLYVLNVAGVGLFTLLTMYYYVQQNQLLSALVRKENAKAEALLLNILPREIAAILKNENRVVADQFDGASVLFADIVGFTPMSAAMAPAELVELLNEVFSDFDAMVDRFGLEKIKTIGDCYMAAAGVPRPRPDHARALTQLALDIRDHVCQHDYRGHKLAFRIGLNSGPVVAGVIGRKKFIYDLWGDAVNTASRMESHGTGGCIQITEATYQLIKDEFACESRGMINVKGKGQMPVWHVVGAKAAA
jgi:guanylate cyclase